MFDVMHRGQAYCTSCRPVRARKTARLFVSCAASAAIVLLLGGTSVSAQIIFPPGNDYLYTVQPTNISFGTPLQQIPPIPGNSFGPGCQPFVGTVPLRGIPLDPQNTHTADTVIRRSPANIGPPGTQTNVPIELVQMSLMSINPITVNCGGNATQWNVLVRERPLAISNGTMLITHDPPGNQGRILTCSINVFVDVTVEPAGGGLPNPVPPLPAILVQSSAIYQWKTTPWTFAYPGSGPNFYPGDGPNTLQNPGDVIHTICPPPPPPDPHETWVPDLLDQDDTSVDFGTTVGGYPPIPADFFDPGSDPFTGQITLRGRPFDIDNLGNTDTLVQRRADPVQPVDPPGAMGSVPIEIIALSLVSVQPMIITYPPTSMLPPEMWSVSVGLSQMTQPVGSLSATKTHPNGGIFTTTLPVLPKLIFTRVDGAVRELDAGLIGLPALQFSLPNGNFVHLPDPMISGMFYHHPLALWIPGVIETIPGNTASQQPESPILPAPEGPAAHRICLPKRQPRVCIYSVNCADGSCDLCPFCTGDVCQAFRCPNLTCPISFSSTCGPDCCLEINLITCGPPSGEPFCPIQQPCPCSPIPGACCEANGTCSVVSECDCNGTYLGDGTVCGPDVACCFADGSCTEMAINCCIALGGFATPLPCDPPLGCCMGPSCTMMDPECCVLQGGQVDPTGCNPPVACCLGTNCVMMDRECCLMQGGQLDPDGVCDPMRQCCIATGCINAEPDCCLLSGGIPGPNLCQVPPTECCLGNGTCLDKDPFCCAQQGGTPSADNCDPPQVCCLNPAQGGACVANIEPDCCVTDLNGLPDGPGACIPEQACCLPNGTCDNMDPFCCVRWGGTPQGAGSQCGVTEACCINGICSVLDQLCCNDLGGTLQGAAACSPVTRACCFPNGTCQNLDPLCCNDQGGVVSGLNCLGDLLPPPLGNGIDDACEGGTPNTPPAPAPAPFNQDKNRYVSFAPNSAGQNVAFRVRKLANPGGGTGRCTVTGNACTGGVAPPAFAQGTCAAGQSCISSYLTGNPGGDCWVQTPTQTASIIPGQNVQFQAVCGLAPVFRVWTESVVHVHGCPIIPATRYEIFVNGVGPIENPTPLAIGTAQTPSLNNKLWGDNVGINNGIIWTAPNGFCNVQDVLSLQAIISGAAIRPTHSVANLRGGSSADGCVNASINSADVLAIVQAIAGASYGPPSTTQPVDPAAPGCKLCPSFP